VRFPLAPIACARISRPFRVVNTSNRHSTYSIPHLEGSQEQRRIVFPVVRILAQGPAAPRPAASSLAGGIAGGTSAPPAPPARPDRRAAPTTRAPPPGQPSPGPVASAQTAAPCSHHLSAPGLSRKAPLAVALLLPSHGGRLAAGEGELTASAPTIRRTLTLSRPRSAPLRASSRAVFAPCARSEAFCARIALAHLPRSPKASP